MKGPGQGPVQGPVNDRWLEQAREPGARALRQALDEARPVSAEDALQKQRVWMRLQSRWGEEATAAADRAAARRGWLAPALAGTAAALALSVSVFVGLTVWRRPEPARPSATGPAVADPVATAPGPRAPAGGAVVPALPDPGVALTAGPGQVSRHLLARGVQAELGPRTVLVPGDATTAPEVKRGRVRFAVPHQRPGQRYSVRAAAYRVVVVGTVFDVAVEGERVNVAVASGTVEVRDGANRSLRLLTAGAQWSSAEKRSDSEAGRTMKQADQLRLRRDPRAALALYQRLAEAGGPRADVALYSMAAIQNEDLNDPRQAALTWQRYQERYPQGMLRVETDLSLIEVYTALHEPKRALREARAFLQNHPDSERRGEVARVAGDLARRTGDCPAALAHYDLALQSSLPPPDLDDALFYRAVCLTDERDSRAAAAVRAYLARLPLGRHAVEAQRLLREPGRP